MPAGVFGQVVAAHEAPVAHVADKLFLTGVRPTVAGKLIRTSKLFVAAVPVTAERLLTCRRRGDGLLEYSRTSGSTFRFTFQTAVGQIVMKPLRMNCSNCGDFPLVQGFSKSKTVGLLSDKA